MFDDFPTFLEILANPAHSRYQDSWREFERRYQPLIAGKLYRMVCNKERVNDCHSRVLECLIARDFKVIKDFKERSSENAFKVYLLTITRSIAIRELKARLLESFSEYEMQGPEQGMISMQNIEDIHGRIVLCFRDMLSFTKKRAYQSERDIFIFTLRKMAKFNTKDVSGVPALNLKTGDIDNIVHRLMKRLQKKGFKLIDFVK